MPRNPPPEQPVRTYPSPNLADQVAIEFVTAELANSKPIEPNTPHPNQRPSDEGGFAGFKLGIQKVSPADHNFFMRIWVKDETSPDVWNYALKFVSESAAHPIFIRANREPKDNWLATYSRARGSALQVVTALHLTLAGSGYTVGTQPALTFAGGAGTGAAGHAIVSPTGTISGLVLTNGGSGYTSAPTFTVAAPPSGMTATGTAAIQPTTAVLVSEEAQLYPQDSEFFALYFNVMRAYQTLPGPILTSKRMSDGAQGAITTNTRQEIAIGTTDYTPDFKTLSYEDTAKDSVVKVRNLELVTDSTFPTLSDYDIDEETGQTILTTYQVVAASSATTATRAAGVVTKYRHIDKWRSLKIVTTYSTPANYNEQRFGAHSFPTLFDYTTYSWSSACGAFATGLRAGFSTMVRLHVVVSHSTSGPADIDGLTLKPVTLMLGKGGQLPSEMLVDAGTLFYSGECSGSASWDASDPDYTTYIGTIQDTLQLITAESVVTKGGLYRTTSVYVLMI